MPSSLGNLGTVDCDTINPQFWPSETRSYGFFAATCVESGAFCGFEPDGSSIADGFNQYGWSISRSSTDPLDTVGPIPVGVVPLYLWMYCNASDGASSFEGAVQGSGSIIPLVITPLSGWLNAGTGLDLWMAVSGCPYAWDLAAEILVLNVTQPVSVESETWSDVKAMFR